LVQQYQLGKNSEISYEPAADAVQKGRDRSGTCNPENHLDEEGNLYFWLHQHNKER
jgi:hypothetical protein